jgi:hypothetical protein
MTHDCPYCGDFVSGYHYCPEGEDRVAFECIDCHEEQNRDAHQMDINGMAPQRCAQCTFARMEAGQ